MTSGYVPSDLGKLCRLAVLRELHNLDNEEASDGNDADNLIEEGTRLKINDNNVNVLDNEVGHKYKYILESKNLFTVNLILLGRWKEFEYAMSIIHHHKKLR